MNGLTSLLSAKGEIDQRRWRKVFRNEMDLFVKVFDVRLIPFEGALVIGIG